MPIVPVNQASDRPLPPVRHRTRIRPLTKADSSTASPPSDKSTALAEPDYAVGYGRPPRHTQFKAGQSGNPKGRPKAAKGLNNLVRDTLTQKVAVRTATGEKKISRIEAVLHKTVEQAMKGNPRALAALIKLYGNAVPDERHDAHDEREDDLTATDLATLEELRRMFSSDEQGDEQ